MAKSASVAPSATIIGPAIIGPDSEVRVGAFIRGNVLIGRGCVVGNSCELKNVILFDNVQTPHYNYVGDSILGYKAHMGAGSIASNFKLDHANIALRDGEEKIDTGLRKFGLILGDFSEIGCGSVTNPGTVIGKECMVYPLSFVRGIIPDRTIICSDGSMKKRI